MIHYQLRHIWPTPPVLIVASLGDDEQVHYVQPEHANWVAPAGTLYRIDVQDVAELDSVSEAGPKLAGWSITRCYVTAEDYNAVAQRGLRLEQMLLRPQAILEDDTPGRPGKDVLPLLSQLPFSKACEFFKNPGATDASLPAGLNPGHSGGRAWKDPAAVILLVQVLGGFSPRLGSIDLQSLDAHLDEARWNGFCVAAAQIIATNDLQSGGADVQEAVRERRFSVGRDG